MRIVKVTNYMAEDGKIFNDEMACLAHEQLCRELDEILSILPPRPSSTSCAFENGEGYIQHDSADFVKAKNDILNLVLEYVDGSRASETIKIVIDESWYMSGRPYVNHVTRSISNYCPGVIQHAWYRFNCTDGSFREWGQPYYAVNPEKGKAERLN